ncbi:MAG: pyridoxamine 5'-phosphate oxidase [Prolixibacteraceae bacterium]
MLKDIRRDYQQFRLDENGLSEHPYDLFRIWMKAAIDSKADEPTAMTLATCEDGIPDTRVVLLKELDAAGFIFFTNYASAKGRQIESNSHVALNFFWSKLERQVRVKGVVEKLKTERSVEYFRSRPRESQLGAWASDQSSEIAGREILESRFKHFEDMYQGKEVRKPDHWGGYLVAATEIEFWQGRPNRLHDRFRYKLEGSGWSVRRLAP